MKANRQEKQANRERPGSGPARVPVYDRRPGSRTTPVKAPAGNRLEPMEAEPLQRMNFIGMIVSAIVIVVGFLLMIGPGSTPEAFNPDIFSTRRIVIGPTLAFIGFILMGWAIIYRPRQKNTPTDTEP